MAHDNRYLRQVARPLTALLLCASMQVFANPIQEIDLASTTAWTLDGVVKPVPAGGWNAQGISRTKDNVVYQRSITLPTYPAGSVVKVLFGAVNHGADVYLDNALVTTHLGPMMPFEADITALVTPGSTHTLKVIGYAAEHYMSGTVCMVPYGWRNQYFSQGISKYVKLAVYPQVYVKDYFIRPSAANKQLNCDLWIHNAGTTARSVSIQGALSSWNNVAWSYPSVPAQDVTLPANSVTKVTIGPVAWNLGAQSYWWPNIPFRENYQAKLHYLRLSVNEGSTVIDTLRPRFGFAEWTEGPYYYKLNGVRIGFQSSDGTNETLMGYYDCYSTAPAFLPPTGPNTGCAETWKRYMRLGISTNRTHASSPTPYMMDVADEVGFMLIPETAIYGSGNKQGWSSDIIPCERELAVLCRNHPSVCRYSIANEYDPYTDGDNWKRVALVDTLHGSDPTRPIVLTIWAPLTSADAYWLSSTPNVVARVNVNYPEDWQTWKATNGSIHAIGEYSWNVADPVPCGKTDLVRVGDRGIEFRRRDIVYAGIWTLTLNWPNFLEGQSAATFGMTPYHNGDRVDGVGGWGSDSVTYVQRALNTYLVLDSVLQNENMCFSSPWPQSVPTYAAGATVNRNLTVFNGGFFGNQMAIHWEARWNTSTGTVAAAGAIDPITIEPGFRATKPLSFTVPSTTATADTIPVTGNARIMYKEDRIYFNVGSQKLYLVLKSVLKDGQIPTMSTHTMSMRPAAATPRTFKTVGATGGRGLGVRDGCEVFDITGRRVHGVSGTGSMTHAGTMNLGKVLIVRTRQP